MKDGETIVIKAVNAPKPRNKVEDVFNGVQSFGQLMSMIAEGSFPATVVMMMSADWMSTMLHKLVEWGAITKAEQTLVLGMIAAERTRNENERQAEEEQNEDDEKDEKFEEFISQFGI